MQTWEIPEVSDWAFPPQASYQAFQEVLWPDLCPPIPLPV